MAQPVIIGVAQTVFGRFPGVSVGELGAQAARAALADSGINPQDIQVAYGGQACAAGTAIQDIMQRVGVTKRPMFNIQNACGTGVSAAHLLYNDIIHGIYDVGIVVGVDSMSSLPKGLLAPSDLNGILGLSIPAHFGMKANRFLKERDATLADLAYPSVKNHKNACLNPYAMYKKELTTEEILNSRVISDPITLLECCPYTDGAAALIMCSEEYARRYTTKPVRIVSSVISSGDYDSPTADLLYDEPVYRISQEAYRLAGIGPEDLDLVELHDAFSPEELWSYESMCLCRKGDSIPTMRAGEFDIGGRCPVNPSGGLLALGHPGGASGVRVICEVVQHLRGTAGARQVEGAKVGLAQMIGGYVTGLNQPVAGGIQILTL